MKAAAGTIQPSIAFESAIQTFRSTRRRTIHLYPGVLSTLTAIRASGVPVIGYTESIAYWTEWRIRETKLDGIIDVLYSSPDYELLNGQPASTLRTQPSKHYGLKQTVHRHVPTGILKPDPHILQAILDDLRLPPERCVYVGDSLMKDVAMAQAVGAMDVYAEYGVSHSRQGYDLLQRVSHWSDADVEREKLLATQPGVIVPTCTLAKSFAQLTEVAEFQKAAQNGR